MAPVLHLRVVELLPPLRTKKKEIIAAVEKRLSQRDDARSRSINPSLASYVPQVSIVSTDIDSVRLDHAWLIRSAVSSPIETLQSVSAADHKPLPYDTAELSGGSCITCSTQGELSPRRSAAQHLGTANGVVYDLKFRLRSVDL